MSTVIIVGAGVAGLEAAGYLTKAGLNVILIEARNRIGGRTYTYKTGDHGSYDLGASWLHDTLRNDLFDFALDHGVKTHYNDNAVMYFGPQGEIDPEQTHTQAAQEIFDEAKLVYEGQPVPADVSFKQFALSFAEIRRSYNDKNRKIAPQIARVLELYHGLKWEKISARYGLLDHAGRDAFVVDNYDTILKHMTARIDKRRFKLFTNSPVQLLDSNFVGKDKVRVVCRDGTEHFGKYIICTVPLGVLKARDSIQFNPPLSNQLLYAIDSLQMAALGKVIFEFESVFWSTKVDRFMSLAQVDGEVSKPWTVPVYFVNSYRMTGRPALISLTAPPLTQYLEANPSVAEEYYRPLLEAMRLDKSKPLPKIHRTIVTAWTQDEFARGSYSAFGIGVDPQRIFTAFEEGAGRLRFAGEHTSRTGTACTHGAFHSGRREAQHIVKMEKKLCYKPSL